MRSFKFLYIRRVVGDSMSPKLERGQLLLATPLLKKRRLRPGQVVVISHDNKQKVKRIERIEQNKIFVIGDNLSASTDSRHFGWLTVDNIIGRVFWPRLAK